MSQGHNVPSFNVKVTVESTRMVMVCHMGHKVPSFNVKVTVESTRMVMLCHKGTKSLHLM